MNYQLDHFLLERGRGPCRPKYGIRQRTTPDPIRIFRLNETYFFCGRLRRAFLDPGSRYPPSSNFTLGEFPRKGCKLLKSDLKMPQFVQI